MYDELAPYFDKTFSGVPAQWSPQAMKPPFWLQIWSQRSRIPRSLRSLAEHKQTHVVLGFGLLIGTQNAMV
jgi:hypothetical protein